MKTKLEKFFFHPFEDHSDRALLMVGLLGFVLMLVISYFGNLVFDGIIQIHLADSEAWQIILGNTSNVAILTLGLFMLSKIIYPPVRLLDLLNNVLIARIPLLFAGLLTLPLQTMLPTNHRNPDDVIAHFENMGTVQMLGIAAIAVLVLALLVYFFYLLVVGIKHSINSKKATHGFIVVLAVLLLDVLATFVYRSWFL